jgi:hypothetical protein
LATFWQLSGNLWQLSQKKVAKKGAWQPQVARVATSKSIEIQSIMKKSCQVATVATIFRFLNFTSIFSPALLAKMTLKT